MNWYRKASLNPWSIFDACKYDKEKRVYDEVKINRKRLEDYVKSVTSDAIRCKSWGSATETDGSTTLSFGLNLSNSSKFYEEMTDDEEYGSEALLTDATEKVVLSLETLGPVLNAPITHTCEWSLGNFRCTINMNFSENAKWGIYG
jgi:hypothetical protein